MRVLIIMKRLKRSKLDYNFTSLTSVSPSRRPNHLTTMSSPKPRKTKHFSSKNISSYAPSSMNRFYVRKLAQSEMELPTKQAVFGEIPPGTSTASAQKQVTRAPLFPKPAPQNQRRIRLGKQNSGTFYEGELHENSTNTSKRAGGSSMQYKIRQLVQRKPRSGKFLKNYGRVVSQVHRESQNRPQVVLNNENSKQTIIFKASIEKFKPQKMFELKTGKNEERESKNNQSELFYSNLFDKAGRNRHAPIQPFTGNEKIKQMRGAKQLSRGRQIMGRGNYSQKSCKKLNQKSFDRNILEDSQNNPIERGHADEYAEMKQTEINIFKDEGEVLNAVRNKPIYKKNANEKKSQGKLEIDVQSRNHRPKVGKMSKLPRSKSALIAKGESALACKLDVTIEEKQNPYLNPFCKQNMVIPDSSFESSCLISQPYFHSNFGDLIATRDKLIESAFLPKQPHKKRARFASNRRHNRSNFNYKSTSIDQISRNVARYYKSKEKHVKKNQRGENNRSNPGTHEKANKPKQNKVKMKLQSSNLTLLDKQDSGVFKSEIKHRKGNAQVTDEMHESLVSDSPKKSGKNIFQNFQSPTRTKTPSQIFLNQTCSTFTSYW